MNKGTLPLLVKGCCFCHSNESANTDRGFISQQKICSKHSQPSMGHAFCITQEGHGPSVERVLVSTEEKRHWRSNDDVSHVDEIFSCVVFTNDSLCLF